MRRPDADLRLATTMALFGAGLAALSTVLPWLSYDAGGTTFSQVGLRGVGGLLALFLAVTAGACSLWVRASRGAPDLARLLVVGCGISIAATAAAVVALTLAVPPAPPGGALQLPYSPAAGLAVTVVGGAFVTAGGWLAAVAPRFRGCARCTEHVAPDDLAKHLVRRHGVAPATAVDEASSA